MKNQFDFSSEVMGWTDIALFAGALVLALVIVGFVLRKSGTKGVRKLSNILFQITPVVLFGAFFLGMASQAMRAESQINEAAVAWLSEEYDINVNTQEVSEMRHSSYIPADYHGQYVKVGFLSSPSNSTALFSTHSVTLFLVDESGRPLPVR